MRGQQHRAEELGEVREQPVVEHLPRHRVEARVGLVEQRHLGAGGQPDRDPERRTLPARQLLDHLARPHPEVVQQRRCQRGVPVRVEPGRGAQRLTDLDVRVGLGLADEHQAAQHVLVLGRRCTEDPHRTR